MPETTLPIATMVAERLRAAIAEKPIALGEIGREIPVTISIGIGMTVERGDTPRPRSAAPTKRFTKPRRAAAIARSIGSPTCGLWRKPDLRQ